VVFLCCLSNNSSFVYNSFILLQIFALKQRTYRRFVEVSLHLLAWLCYFFYDWLIRANIIEFPQYAWLEFKASILRTGMLGASAYAAVYLILNKKHFFGRKLISTLLLLLLILLSGLIIRVVIYLLVYCHFFNGGNTITHAFNDISKTIGGIVNGAFVISAAAMVYYNRKWQKEARMNQELKTAHKQAELSLLKSQVKPHFILNTLNNIYALAVKGSGSTADMIYRLSDLFRYMLYHSQQSHVLLKDELNYIENYLSLEKIRYTGRLDILINRFNSIEGVRIPPLILLPLVENAVTHGISKQVGECWIRIDVSYDNYQLTLKVENSKPETVALKPESGIGLKNVRQRLELLYDGRQQMQVFDNKNSFLVVLKLKYKGNDKT
jgi:two-component system, LytTR family, sensor kinase